MAIKKTTVKKLPQEEPKKRDTSKDRVLQKVVDDCNKKYGTNVQTAQVDADSVEQLVELLSSSISQPPRDV